MMKATIIPLIALWTSLSAASITGLQNLTPSTNQPQPILLWPNGAPGAKGAQSEDVPSIQLYQPPADKSSGAAIVVCPGGGYAGLAPYEGHDIALWLKGIGVTAVVLKYRLGPRYQHPAMMHDVKRAIRYSRSKAVEWKIDPNRVGVMGFSAGGHLASTAATHFDDGDPKASDPIEKMRSRPDLAILCYPVITMNQGLTHAGSRKNLLGENPAQELVDLMSNEKQVTAKTPPTFLFHTKDDKVVPIENSLLFVEALKKNNVPHELRVYEHGPHGVGLASRDPVLSTWTKHLENWLRARGFLTNSQNRVATRPVEIENLIYEARTTPPEFAASALLRVAESKKISDIDWKRELIEEAFALAARAQHPVKRRYTGGSVDTRTGYLNYAYDLKLDRLSLQSRAVRAMIAVNPVKAREMLSGIPQLEFSLVDCEETLVYEVADFYETLAEIARTSFTAEQLSRNEHVQFIEPYVRDLAHPSQVHPLARVLQTLKTSPERLYNQVLLFSNSLRKVAGDDRSYTFDAYRTLREITQLINFCASEKITRDELLNAYRDYLINHLHTKRCADNVPGGKPPVPAILGSNGPEVLTTPSSPAYLNVFNTELRFLNAPSSIVIPPISDEDAAHTSVGARWNVHDYWQSQQGKELLIKAKELRFGPMEQQLARQKEGKKSAPLVVSERTTLEWNRMLDEFLTAIDAWRPQHENSEADYFHQKCVLLEGLVELIPPGSMRERGLGEYVNFLRLNRFQQDSFIEWFFHARMLVLRTDGLSKGDRNWILAAYKTSGDTALKVFADLEMMFPISTSTEQ